MTYEEQELRREIMRTRDTKNSLFYEIEALHERVDIASSSEEEDRLYTQIEPLQARYDKLHHYIDECSDKLRDLLHDQHDAQQR